MSERKMVEVYRASELEAHVIKGLLESEGIPVLLRYESAGKVYGITVDGIGEIKVMVPEARAEEAKSIIVEEERA